LIVLRISYSLRNLATNIFLSVHAHRNEFSTRVITPDTRNNPEKAGKTGSTVANESG